VKTTEGVVVPIEIMQGEIKFMRLPAEKRDLRVQVDVLVFQTGVETEFCPPALTVEWSLDLTVDAVDLFAIDDRR